MRSLLMLLPLALSCVAAVPRVDAPKIPFAFETNQGQTAKDVRFIARGEGYAVFLREQDAIIRLGREGKQVRMSLRNARQAASIQGLERLTQATNYFVGNDSKQWKRAIPNYARVRYEGVYPGVDLVYHSLEKQLEYDFVVAPGKSAAPIELRFDGAERMEILPNGELALHLDGRVLTHKAPYAYQEVNGRRQTVRVQYARRGEDGIGFAVGSYDASKPLVIDPVLVYSTYLGGNRADAVTGMAVDKDGAVYVTGETVSIDFPVKGTNLTPYQGAVNYGFIAKFAPNGGSLIYSTIIGGASNTTPTKIAVDDEGNAYVTGITGARNFPLVNPVQSNNPGLNIGFVLKLNAKGDALIFSTLHGGERNDRFNAIAIDKQKNIYVTGAVTSTTFPLVNAWQTKPGGSGQDLFVAKYTAPNYRLAYSSYYGGTGYEEAYGIAVDDEGYAYIAGATRSPDFATAGAYQTRYRGTEDAFVAKIRPNGGPVWFTYLGGTGDEMARGIALDAEKNIWIGGTTSATTFPVTANAIQPTMAGRWDAFLSKFSNDGSQLLYSTYYGGAAGNNASYSEAVHALAIDAAGDVYLAGVTRATDFPAVRPLQSYGGGDTDAFLVKYNVTRNEIEYSTPFGGSSPDEANTLAVDALGGVYFGGETFSPNFTTKNAFRATFGPSSEGFVTKLCDPVLIADQASMTFLQVQNAVAPAAQNLKVSACVAIPYTIEVQGDFLKATPTSGNTDATVAVSVDGRNLAIGDYDGKLIIRSADVKNSPLEVPVRLRVNPPPPQITANGIVNAASSKGGPVVPGELIVMYGVNLGPASLVGFNIAGGAFANELAGTRVYFDGIPAPLVYTSSGQVSAIVPYGIAGRPSTQVQLEFRGARSNAVAMSVAAAAPALFTLNASGSGPGAILNQDYSVNTAANGAERGSIVILYATGEGVTDPISTDGQIVTNVLAKPRQAVKVTIGGQDAIVDYAGSAPGLVAGVFQINVRIPPNAASGNQPVMVSVGNATSPAGVTLSVK